MCHRRRLRTVPFSMRQPPPDMSSITPPAEAAPVHNPAETIFERLTAKGLTWRVYCDAPSPASFTGIIHASRLHERFKTNFRTVADFVSDAQSGQLPAYSFIE